MFYYKKGLTRCVQVHPKYIGGKNDTLQIARKMARQSFVESPFSPEYGYIASLVVITDVGDGHCMPLVGNLEFPVTFEAVVIFPMVGEVIFADVVMVTASCIIFRSACIYGVIRDYSLNDRDEFEYEERPLLGKDKKKGPIMEGLYRSKKNPAKTIERDSVVRLRILRRTLGGNGFFLIGSMFGDFLGPLEAPPPACTSSSDSELDDEVLRNLRVENDVIPHDELQQIRKKNSSKKAKTKSNTDSVIMDDACTSTSSSTSTFCTTSTVTPSSQSQSPSPNQMEVSSSTPDT